MPKITATTSSVEIGLMNREARADNSDTDGTFTTV
jgi:hypothetical protein